MVHTLSITHRIISPKMFDELYKRLEEICRVKPRKIQDGCYVTTKLSDDGFTEIILSSKKVDGRYKNNYMQITIILNPLKLMGHCKLDILEEDQVEVVTKIFYEKVQNIHKDLPKLYYWITNRVDYAINIKTPYVKEYIKLFQRGDKPRNFKELYCSKSKARKQMEGSFYIFNKSVNINFYDKEQEQLWQNFNTDEAKDLLRLEVQCKKPKTNTIKSKYIFDSKQLKNYLNKEISYKQLEYYYNATIGKGDYYKLTEAIEMVQDSNYTSSTKAKLIEVLRAVNKCRSIWKAREEIQYSSTCFNRYLKQIRSLGVNPVTIPGKWRVDKLKNII